MPVLMIQGCTSDAGKSTLVAGLCRLLANQGVVVAPFKPQNMANNSAVTDDGGEIGRAQALQALAARVPLSVHMNPVLLKPNSDTGAQVIIQGHSIGNLNAMDYHDYKPRANAVVLESYKILSQQYQTILVEGAGSPAEINLRQNDIANMGFAEAIDCPVILIADIDKGGVFAHIIGTLECLSATEQNRIKGFVINRFRGDIKLLQDGLDWLEEKTGKPVLGVLPYLHNLHLDAEDAIANIASTTDRTKNFENNSFKVICPLLPHLSNHTDLDPLILHPNIDFKWVRHDEAIPPADWVILPGSKSIAFDLNWLKSQGWQSYLKKHLRYGGKITGICGGLQMLGKDILDPLQIESKIKKVAGLNLMPYTTTLAKQKQLEQVTGKLNLASNSIIKGYKIHQGITKFNNANKHAINLDHDKKSGEQDGTISQDNQILATYCHGIFDQPKALTSLLNWAGHTNTETFDINQHREQQLELLADTLAEHLDMEKIIELISD